MTLTLKQLEQAQRSDKRAVVHLTERINEILVDVRAEAQEDEE